MTTEPVHKEAQNGWMPISTYQIHPFNKNNWYMDSPRVLVYVPNRYVTIASYGYTQKGKGRWVDITGRVCEPVSWMPVPADPDEVNKMNLAFDAMIFAREAHKEQRRKYTNNPYVDHLAEVAGLVATVSPYSPAMIAVAWLHDCVEDCGVSIDEIEMKFGLEVAIGVSGLSDVEQGNRAERKHLSRERLATCSSWIQTIKVADLISNTSSIVIHDPKFAVVYLEEKRLLLNVLTKADKRLVAIANQHVIY